MEHFHGTENQFNNNLLREHHMQLMLECVNALEEAEKSVDGNSREMSGGKTMWIAKWDDADDIHYRLTAVTYVKSETGLSPVEEQSLRSDYYLSRESTMPHIQDELYYFTNIAEVVQRCDASRRGVPNESPMDDFSLMQVVLGMLRDRPTRQEPSEDIQKIALGYILDDKEKNMIIRSLTQRIGYVHSSDKNPITPDIVVKSIMQLDPTISERIATEHVRDEIARQNQASLPAGESSD